MRLLATGGNTEVVGNLLEAYGKSMQRRALGVLHGCVAALGIMRGVYAKQTRELLAPYLPSFCQTLTQLVRAPTNLSDVTEVSIKLEAFRCLLVATQNFGKLLQGEMGGILAGSWEFYKTAAPMFEALAVYEDCGEDGDVDSDGDELNLEALISQMVEFLLTILGSSRFQHLIKPFGQDLVYTLMQYMQMTTAQEEMWMNDCDQYIADMEDDVMSARVSGEMLLDSMVDEFGSESLQLVWAATYQRLRESAQVKAAGNPAWWKIREAALLALGSVADKVQEAFPGKDMVLGAIDIPGFFDKLLTEDLGEVCRKACYGVFTSESAMVRAMLEC
eukprot:gene11224-13265_t